MDLLLLYFISLWLEPSEFHCYSRGRNSHPSTNPLKRPTHILFSPALGYHLGQINFIFGLHMVRPTAKLTCATRNVLDETIGLSLGPAVAAVALPYTSAGTRV